MVLGHGQNHLLHANKYDEFHSAVYKDNTLLDKKTKHLVCLAASLASGCGFCAKYALTVLNECEVSKDELEEVKAIAMTVNATKIKIQLMDAEKELSNKSK